MKTGPIESIKYCLKYCNYKVDEIALALEAPQLLQKRAINSYINSINNGFSERIKCKKMSNNDVSPYDLFVYPFLWQKKRRTINFRTKNDYVFSKKSVN